MDFDPLVLYEIIVYARARDLVVWLKPEPSPYMRLRVETKGSYSVGYQATEAVLPLETNEFFISDCKKVIDSFVSSIKQKSDD